MSDPIKIIEFFDKAEEGYYAIVALPEPVVKIKRKWLFWNRESKVEYTLYPIMFWASMFLAQGDVRGNSIVVGMVRHNDGVYPAPLIEGYVGIKTPQDKSVMSIKGIKNAIAKWREERQQQQVAAKERAQSMN